MKEFELFKGKDNQYYFRLMANNGEQIAQSEGYHNKEDARNTINSIKKNAASALIIDKTDPNDLSNLAKKTLLGS